jgi:hypothetical protein
MEIEAFDQKAVLAIELAQCALALVQSGPTKEDTDVWSWGPDDRFLGRGQKLGGQGMIPSKIADLVDESVIQVF